MIKLFESFKEIENICKRYIIRNYTINPDGSIDVKNNVNISVEIIKKLPLKFNQVSGYFWCGNNLISSLEGAPREVGGDFYCHNNRLVSLKGAPRKVGEFFTCSHNDLTSLEGAPYEVNEFNCDHNKLTSLENAPRKINSNFNCTFNKIWTFEGAPDYVKGIFECVGNPICNIWKLFKDYSKVELFNYYDIIREIDGNPAVVLERLNDFLEEINEKPVKKVEGYINI